ncbi:MAG: hypothetical protein E7536_03095 [Ruminococcaceae bacterium]|nr:hypothetical protein [Oscillospiraceae bacterium]
MEAFVELITSVGFPIACVIALGIFIYKIYQKSEQREDKLMNEITETRLVNAKAIETITKYADSFEVIKHDISEIKVEVSHLAEKIN